LEAVRDVRKHSDRSLPRTACWSLHACRPACL